MKLLSDIPMLTMTELKASPMTGFEEADAQESGVYVLRNGVPQGVLVTKEQFDQLCALAAGDNASQTDVLQ